MPDTEAPIEDQNWFDHLLKWAMANGTIMRRWIAMGIVSGVIFVVVAIQLIERTDSNATAGQKAICAIIEWGETTLNDSPTVATAQNPKGRQRFKDLIHDMRATGVDCPPPGDPQFGSR